MTPTYILHRVNKIFDLNDVHKDWGVEIDLRSRLDHPGEIILSHDPWTDGDLFSKWIERFVSLGIRGPIILNTKEDGLEAHIMEVLNRFSITNYFFLDTTLPTLVKHSLNGLGEKFSVRLSSYEPIEFVSQFIGTVRWLWVDCFLGKPVEVTLLEALKKDFKICLVSPELHGQSNALKNFRSLSKFADLICTKTPENWDSGNK